MLLYLFSYKKGVGYSPIFRQIRIGKNKVPFILYKFRSMKPIAPETLTHECPDDFYLPKVVVLLEGLNLMNYHSL